MNIDNAPVLQLQPFRLRLSRRKRGDNVAFHAHDEAQLIFASSGTMQVYTQSGRWLVPPQLAVWVPAGIPHSLEIFSDIELKMIYCPPSMVRRWAPATSLDRDFALRITPLLRELIFRAFEINVISVKTELIVRLILQELTQMEDAPTFLPMPRNPKGRHVAELALSDPRMRLDIAELAFLAATSARTISRLFPLETGLTFKAWRQRARIVHAIDQLSEGKLVTQVALQTGFASTAAFSFAFRQVTKMTPTAFYDGFLK